VSGVDQPTPPPRFDGELSVRGRKLVQSPPMPEYLSEHFRRSATDGYIPLCVAENKLVTDLVLAKISECDGVPARVLGYDAMIGSYSFREALAHMMGRKFLGRSVAPEQVVVLAGAGTVLETLFYVLANPGDGVLVPTPSYAGFWLDLETRNEVRILPVHCSSADGFRLTPERLDAALAGAERPVRALLFTSPDNPLGRVHSAEEIRQVMRWAERAGVHLVMDEIYALSVFGEREFVSALSLGALGDWVHIVWAFSKDFAASGLRAGVLVSENQAILQAVDQLAYWGCCSGDTQYRLGQMIADDDWVDSFVVDNCARLRQAAERVTSALAERGLDHITPEAGFFLLLDLRRFLSEPSFEAERSLFRLMLEKANVNLTPGASCRVSEPGFFRLCFAGVPTDAAVEGVERIGQLLGTQ
jgi:aspartate/methionine/tyrosine aminotransferase